MTSKRATGFIELYEKAKAKGTAVDVSALKADGKGGKLVKKLPTGRSKLKGVSGIHIVSSNRDGFDRAIGQLNAHYGGGFAASWESAGAMRNAKKRGAKSRSRSPKRSSSSSPRAKKKRTKTGKKVKTSSSPSKRGRKKVSPKGFSEVLASAAKSGKAVNVSGIERVAPYKGARTINPPTDATFKSGQMRSRLRGYPGYPIVADNSEDFDFAVGLHAAQGGPGAQYIGRFSTAGPVVASKKRAPGTPRKASTGTKKKRTSSPKPKKASTGKKKKSRSPKPKSKRGRRKSRSPRSPGANLASSPVVTVRATGALPRITPRGRSRAY